MPIGYFAISIGLAAAIEPTTENGICKLKPPLIKYMPLSLEKKTDLADSTALKNLKSAILLIDEKRTPKR